MKKCASSTSIIIRHSHLDVNAMVPSDYITSHWEISLIKLLQIQHIVASTLAISVTNYRGDMRANGAFSLGLTPITGLAPCDGATYPGRAPLVTRGDLPEYLPVSPEVRPLIIKLSTAARPQRDRKEKTSGMPRRRLKKGGTCLAKVTINLSAAKITWDYCSGQWQLWFTHVNKKWPDNLLSRIFY